MAIEIIPDWMANLDDESLKQKSRGKPIKKSIANKPLTKWCWQ